MRNVFPLRRPPPAAEPRDFHAAWRAGCDYGERLSRLKGRIEGVFMGLGIACLVALLAYYFGGL